MRARIPLLLTLFSAGLAGGLRADSRVEKTLKLDPGGRFVLDTDDGAVSVAGTSGSAARVVFASPRSDLEDRLAIRFEAGPGSVRVTAKNRRRGWFEHGNGRVRVTVEVPFQTAVEIHTAGGSIDVRDLRAPATLRTSGGALSAEGLAGDLDAETSGGSIALRDIRGSGRVRTSGGGIEAIKIEGSLDAGSSGGSVEVQQISGDLRAHSSGGPIRITEAGGRIDADTSGGGIRASFARGNSKGGHLESSGGGITVSVDPAARLSIDADGDSVDTDLPLEVRGSFSHGSLHGRLNGGGGSLRVETSGGSVRIRAL
ncbi:MAG: DUF4097 family beta strand repeat-containing protein [Thermoanaerobaculia bacterium]